MKETRREEPTSLLIFDWKYFWRPGPKGTHGGPGPFLNWTGPAVAFLRTIGVFVLPMNHSRHRPPAPLPKVGTRCQSLFKMHEGVCWILGLCVAVCVSLSPLPPIFITSSVCVSLLRQQQKQQIPPFANPPPSPCCEHGSAPRGEHPGAGPSFKAEPPRPDPRGCRAPFKRITQRGAADGKTNSAVLPCEALDPPL